MGLEPTRLLHPLVFKTRSSSSRIPSRLFGTLGWTRTSTERKLQRDLNPLRLPVPPLELIWYRGRDSNPHGLYALQLLRLVCLPIPPPRLIFVNLVCFLGFEPRSVGALEAPAYTNSARSTNWSTVGDSHPLCTVLQTVA